MPSSTVDCLLSWLKTFSSIKSSVNSITDVSDGTLLSIILDELDPFYFQLSPSTNSDFESQKDNLNSLIDSIESYTNTVIKKQISISLDIHKVINKDQNSCEQLCSLVLMVFCYSPNNNSYLDVISSLPSDISTVLANIVQDLASNWNSILDEDVEMNSNGHSSSATAFGSSYESIRAEVEEIQHTNEELKKENLLVKSTNEELTAQIAMLQDQVQTLTQQLEASKDLEEQINDYKSRVGNLTAYVEEYQQQLESVKIEADTTIKKLTSDLAKKENELEVNRAFVEEQTQQLNIAKKSEKKEQQLKLQLEEYKEYKTKYNQLLEQNNQNTQELMALREKLDSYGRCSSDIQSLNDELVRVNNEKMELQTDFEALTNNYNSVNEQYNVLYKSYKELELKYTNNMMDHSTENANLLNSSIQNSIGQFVNYDERSSREIELSNEINQLKAENSRLRAQLEQDESAQRQVYVSASQRYEENTKQFQTKITDLKVDVLRYKNQIEELNHTIDALKQEMNGMNQYKTELSSQNNVIQQLQQQLDEQSRLLAERNQEVIQKENEKSQLSSYYNQKVNELQQTTSSITDKNKQLEQTLQGYIQEIKFLKANKNISSREQERMMSCVYNLGNRILNNQYVLSQNVSRSADWMNQSYSMSTTAQGLEYALRKDQEQTKNN